MKKYLFLVLVAFAVMFSVSVSPCEAKDVWVERWQQNHADVYVMDDTLGWEENLNGKFFRVSTKLVQNGKLKSIIKWKFVKIRDEMWRYETNQMGATI